MKKKSIIIIVIISVSLSLTGFLLCWLYYYGPLHLTNAATKGDVARIKHITSLGVSPNQNGFLQGTPINCAIASGKINAVKELYNLGANLNDIDGYGVAPIHASVIYKQHAILKWLLENHANGVQINLLSRSQKTALDYAIEKENKQIIDLLRKHGAKTAQKLKDNPKP